MIDNAVHESTFGLFHGIMLLQGLHMLAGGLLVRVDASMELFEHICSSRIFQESLKQTSEEASAEHGDGILTKSFQSKIPARAA